MSMQSGYWLVTLRKGSRHRALLLRRGGALWRFRARKELDAAVKRAFAGGWESADMVFYADNGEQDMRQCVIDTPRTERECPRCGKRTQPDDVHTCSPRTDDARESGL